MVKFLILLVTTTLITAMSNDEYVLRMLLFTLIKPDNLELNIVSNTRLSHNAPPLKQHAVRFSVTEKCNYQCFFCHEEGLAMATARHPAHEQPLRELLVQLKAAGVRDWTFTGGEPLLRQDNF